MRNVYSAAWHSIFMAYAAPRRYTYKRVQQWIESRLRGE
jgi:hypothetical protein